MTEFKLTRRDGLVCLLLAAATLAIFWPLNKSLFLDYDDNMYILENVHVRSGLSWNNVAWAFTTGYAANWHPLTWISHMIDCQLYGLDAGNHHQTNLLFHVANTLLLFCLLRVMTGTFWRSLLVAAFFAWHPTHVESVAWIAERKDVLSTFFWALTVWAYVAYVRRPGTMRYGLILVLYALGLMSKPMLVTLPCVLLRLDFWPLRRAAQSSEPDAAPAGLTTWPRLVMEKVPLFAMSLASSVVTYCVQKAGGASSLHQLPAGGRIANALVSYARYLGKVFWPTHLAVLYPIKEHWPLGQTIGAGLILLVVTIAAIRLARQRPYLIVGWLWFLGMLVPVIGLVQVGETSIADRYLYLPAVGIFIGAVWLIAELRNAWPEDCKWTVMPLAAVALAGCLLGSGMQVYYWRDSVALFQHTLAVTTANPVAAFDLGQILSSAGKVKEAAPYYLEELRWKPDDDRAYNNLGLCLAMQGQFTEATNYYAQSLKLNPTPDYAASTHFNYSLALTALGDVDGAIVQNLESLRLAPDRPQEQYAAGLLLADKGRFEEAKTHLSTAVKLKPDLAEAQVKLGFVLTQLGESSEAVGHFQQALQLNPDSVEALNNLAWIRAANARPELRDGAESVRLAQHACELTGNAQPALLGTLAAAYAEAGQFAEAQATAKKASELAVANGQSDLAARNQRLLEIYQSNRPYRESSAAAQAPKP